MSPMQRGASLYLALSPVGLPSSRSSPWPWQACPNPPCFPFCSRMNKSTQGLPLEPQPGDREDEGSFLCPHSLSQAGMPASRPALWGPPLALEVVLGPLTSPGACRPLYSAS